MLTWALAYLSSHGLGTDLSENLLRTACIHRSRYRSS